MPDTHVSGLYCRPGARAVPAAEWAVSGGVLPALHTSSPPLYAGHHTPSHHNQPRDDKENKKWIFFLSNPVTVENVVKFTIFHHE